MMRVGDGGQRTQKWGRGGWGWVKEVKGVG